MNEEVRIAQEDDCISGTRYGRCRALGIVCLRDGTVEATSSRRRPMMRRPIGETREDRQDATMRAVALVIRRRLAAKRLRQTDVRLTEAHASEKGLYISRTKGSNDNIVKWTRRLKTAWDAALAVARRRWRGPAINADRFRFAPSSASSS